ncbi:MAG: hypothetical protein LLG14_14160 [Nocardiaceae bacterium]|nr:hypothetical protein [Nocardiaceae bacterium]
MTESDMRKWRLAATAAAAALLVGGCSEGVVGTARPLPQITPANVQTVLLDTSQFPNTYPAVVLPPQVAVQAAGDMSGLPDAAENISPSDCRPDAPPSTVGALAVAVGTNESDRSTLTLIVENVGSSSIETLHRYVTHCADITAKNRAAEISVHTEVLPSPADLKPPSFVWRRVVRSGSAQASLHETMVTMAGQVGAIRVLVTYMTFGSPAPDLDAMKTVLNSQLSKIKHS